MKRKSTTSEARREVRRAIQGGLARPIHNATSFALLASIHAEVEGEIGRLREAQAMLDNCYQRSRGVEAQGYVFSLAKYGDAVRKLDVQKMLPDLGSENEPLAASINAGMFKAESETRQAADIAALKAS